MHWADGPYVAAPMADVQMGGPPFSPAYFTGRVANSFLLLAPVDYVVFFFFRFF